MRLWTRRIGDGPKTAALVHGLSGSSETWFEFAPWIAGLGYTVTLVDQRGHGNSPRAASYAASDLAGDLVDTLPAGMDVVLGHSLGGRALALAAERLRPGRAVYLDPGWCIPPDLVLEMPEGGALIGAEEFLAAYDWLTRPMAETMARVLAQFDPVAVRSPNVPLPSMEPAPEPVVPSLVVVPDPSMFVTRELQERLAAGGYEVRRVQGAEHELHMANLEETKHALRGWL